MYVEDIDDLEELQDLQAEAERTLSRPGSTGAQREQAEWDLEDIAERIADLSDEVGGLPG
ncbi:hypothetical protein CRB1_78 [Mycobacterium phage CRB1]|uniref:hypothetical protein n=1 Tax=Mycobacterium phage CRB1 TaxID=1458841 RepID=UPI0003F20359|nr:hypothetical protein CRB1_78 [Mycobacterium phage CRB1]AHJ86689.1 hypothetical protein CRB1_78 [Mycobacterium phage CRB1]